MITLFVYLVTLAILTYGFKKHKFNCKVSVMEMNFRKFNVLAVTFLLAILELACIISLVIDLFIDDNHNVELSLIVLNSIILGYYLIKHKSNIRYYYVQLKKIGRKK